jgi:lipoate-protein ligase A
MEWEILDTGLNTAQVNMDLDAQLLQELETSPRPILHFYDWKEESATYGCFVDPDKHLKKTTGLDLGKRPTGGGIIFHIWDFAFSVLIPSSHPKFSSKTIDNYIFINSLVLRAVQSFIGKIPELIVQDATLLDPSCSRFCMAHPTKYDVMMDGKKIAGAAQRWKKWGYLHQGSIALVMPDENLLSNVLREERRVKKAMMTYTYPLLGQKGNALEIQDARDELKKLLKHVAKTENSHLTYSL